MPLPFQKPPFSLTSSFFPERPEGESGSSKGLKDGSRAPECLGMQGEDSASGLWVYFSFNSSEE